MGPRLAHRTMPSASSAATRANAAAARAGPRRAPILRDRVERQDGQWAA